VEALGYRGDDDGVVWDGEQRFSRLGARKAVLNDLSPAATFIAYNYNTPVDAHAFEREAKRILQEVEREYGWMYETWHPNCDDPNRLKGRINYTVWSDVFVCPECGHEMVFWDVAVDQEAGQVHRQFACPGCGAQQKKSTLERAWESVYDRALGQTIRRARQVPVLVNYSVDRTKYEKLPDTVDRALIRQIESSDIPYWFPSNEIPIGDKTSEPIRQGIRHINHLYTKRNLMTLSCLWRLIEKDHWLSHAFTGVSPRALENAAFQDPDDVSEYDSHWQP
jgi:predicted RNA-binding Zn-ribbon protein involved in translation (DUF1610 family)